MIDEIKKSKGASLLEIIIAIAILSLVVVSLLNVFSFSIAGIFGSGNRSNMVMEVQDIVDKLQTQNDTPPGLNTQAEIETYLDINYKKVAKSDLTTWDGTNDVNFYVEEKKVTAGGFDSIGWEVTIVKFFNDGKRTVQLTTIVT
ncbi:MAG: prepilin-type N-terminal cleavage/methylation domain-containing protein [Saccharofermentanales bacterium]